MMRIKDRLLVGAEKALEITIKACEPFAEIKPRQSQEPKIDTQELTERASRIIETDSSRAIFACYVMMELEAERLSPSQADYYLTPPEERELSQ